MPTSDEQRLAGVWDTHTAAEFGDRDPDAAVATMTEDTVLVHVPIGVGGTGLAAVREFYTRFLAQVPDDIDLELLTRTVVPGRLIDEFVVRFTHTIRMDWFVPGIEPTGRSVVVPHVAIVEFREDLICSEHIYWDHASVLVQLGVLDPGDLPVLGADQAERLHSPVARFHPVGSAR